MDDLPPRISSLAGLAVEVSNDIKDHLRTQYQALEKYEECSEEEARSDHLSRVLEAMKLPPQITTCRVNLLLSSVDDVLDELNQFLESLTRTNEDCESSSSQLMFQAHRHSALHDVIEIRVTPSFSNVTSLAKHCIIPKETSEENVIFSNWKLRQKLKFPLHYKVVICDRMCGEAVLRGSNIFVRGIVAADKNVEKGDKVCVYAHVENCTLRRGLTIENYHSHCIFLGLGQVTCSRAEMFNQTHGLGVAMFNSILHSQSPNKDQIFSTRAGPLCPPMNGILSNKMMLQNLPSMLVAHVLEPKSKDIIADLCCAPGGKTSHVASLVGNDATIVAMDKSRKKMKAVKTFFQNMGASCITPIALDSTKCVLEGGQWMSVEDILSSAVASESDGLLKVKGFYPASFDKIVLDPPCSALGLRPKLCVDIKSLVDLNKHAEYQRKFIRCAVSLLKNGGTLVYSTCTINSCENEKMVRYILDNFESMTLVPIRENIGLPGLPGCGLNDEERHMVRRFDPSDVADTMGFFIAKFAKYSTIS